MRFRRRFFNKLNDWSRQFAYWCTRNAEDGKCMEDTMPSSHMTSKYDLVGSVKYGMDHANFNSIIGDGATTIYSMKFQFAEVAMFVANVFCDQTSRNVDHIGIIYIPVMSEPDKYGERYRAYTSARLIFDEITFNAFVEWLDTYKTRFPIDYNFKQLLPVIQDGDNVSGYCVDHKCEFSVNHANSRKAVVTPILLPHDDLYDEWLWMLNNTSGMVRILGDKWVFEDSSDAMMYKLQKR